MSSSLLNAVFGCRHRRTTFPLTPIRRKGNVTRSTTECGSQTYIACLDCGRELAYDWGKMQRIKSTFFARSIHPIRRSAS